MDKGLLLISSGLDSPVAGYLVMKQGMELVAVHFNHLPAKNDLSEMSVKKIVQHLSTVFNKSIKLYVIQHNFVHLEFLKKCNKRFVCVLCKRMMLRIAERIAEKEKCGFLVMGDNLGQVASQTLSNMANISEATRMIIIRPLLCNDKMETINIARKIGTYDLSSGSAVCCVAVPKNPLTHSNPTLILEEEGKVDIKSLVEKALEGAEVMAFP